MGLDPCPSPPDFTDGVITIRSGHTATLSTSETLDQVVVENGATLNVNSFRTLTLNDVPGTDLRVFGTVNNNGTINSLAAASILFTSTGVYNHTRDGGNIPGANWNSDSDCNITGVTNSMPSGLDAQSFGNFTWNCASHSGNLYLQSGFTVQGNMTVSSTGPVYDPNTRALRMSNTASGYTITVLGDFIVDNLSTFKMNNGTGSCTMNVLGDFYLNSGCYCIVTGGASSTLNVAGNVSVVGGDFIINEDGSFSTASFNIDGDFAFSGGIIRDSGTGPCEINFTGTGTQTYIKTGGSFQNDVDFDVAAGSILDMGTYVINGSSGDFTLNPGAGIITAHPPGSFKYSGYRISTGKRHKDFFVRLQIIHITDLLPRSPGMQFPQQMISHLTMPAE